MAKVATDRKQLNTQMANIICDLCSGFYLKQYFSQQSYLFVGNTGKEDKNSKLCTILILSVIGQMFQLNQVLCKSIIVPSESS